MGLYCLIQLPTTQASEIDFDAMDNAMVATGIDKDIKPRDPSWLELKVRRLADPIVVALSRCYMRLSKSSTVWLNYLHAQYIEKKLAMKAYCERVIRKA